MTTGSGQPKPCGVLTGVPAEPPASGVTIRACREPSTHVVDQRLDVCDVHATIARGEGRHVAPRDVEVPPKIAAVAIRFHGQVLTLPPPCRHAHIINLLGQAMGAAGLEAGERCEDQGFVDVDGKYLTREEAYVVAKAHGQIVGRVGKNTYQGTLLFSEDLW